jgi:predicted amidohydrolase
MERGVAPLSLSVLELPARWGQPEAQLALVDAALGRLPKGLLLLPELSLTGYVSPALGFDVSARAEPLEGPTAQALAALAARHGQMLVGPLVERDGPWCFNTVVGFRADGTRFLHYRKRHPWMPEEWATPGDKPWPLVEVAGLTVTAAICFDVHFLAEEATAALEAADVLLFPSAWVDEESDARTPLLVELATRFSLTVVNANWGLGVPAVTGQGGSCVVAPSGEVTRVRPGTSALTVDAGGIP